MEQRAVGSSGLRVSKLGLGTMTWGRETDEDDAAAQLSAFRDAGGTLLDTAAVYGNGESEAVIGRLLRDVVPRDEVVLATKAGIGVRGDDRVVDVSRGALLDALDASLGRLAVDHVDLWQVHTWDDGAPLEETMSALDVAVSSGRARYVGISNYSGWQTARAATWQAAWPGRARLVSTQMAYSLLERGLEREVLPAALDAGMGLFPWSPLGGGVLTGKYRQGRPADSRAAELSRQGATIRYFDDRSAGIVEAVATAADGLGTSPLAVALAWVRDRPGVAAPIVGARTVGQLMGSLLVDGLTLPGSIRDALDDVSAPALGYPEQPIP